MLHKESVRAHLEIHSMKDFILKLLIMDPQNLGVPVKVSLLNRIVAMSKTIQKYTHKTQKRKAKVKLTVWTTQIKEIKIVSFASKS